MNKLNKAITSAGLLLMLGKPAFAQSSYGTMWGHGWGYGGMFFGGFLMLLFWGGVIALIVLAIRAFTPGSSRSSASGVPSTTDHTAQALGILSERYARGEIDKSEFDERRATLLSLNQKANEMP